MAIPQESVELIKVLGIVGSLLVAGIGLLLNAYATLRGITSRKLVNYHELIKGHRDLWKLTLDKPETYARVLTPNLDLARNPMTYAERRFVNLLLLHMTTVFSFTKKSDIVKIEKLKADIDDVLAYPIPRTVWLEDRHYFNKDFVRFVEEPRNANRWRWARQRSPVLVHTKRWTILVLTTFKERIVSTLAGFGDKLLFLGDPGMTVTADFVEDNQIDLIFCFGYGKILAPGVLARATAINLHCGFLPFDRGPNPHLWSVLRRSPRGATIHHVDAGIDTGDIIAQRSFEAPAEDVSFQESFDRLIRDSVALLSDTWPSIRAGTSARSAQQGTGSKHTLNDQRALESMWTEDGLALPLKDFRAAALALLAHPETNALVAKDPEVGTAGAER